MVLDKKVAEQTVNFLTQINAIKLNTKNPFTWTSGIKSPIYCDNRLLLSYPEIRKFIAEKMSEIIKNKYGENISITGVATGAIAIGALIAERLNLPYSYVRPEPKNHGLKNQIEGFIDKGSEKLSFFMSPCGIEKGLWLNFIFLVNSSFSNIG